MFDIKSARLILSASQQTSTLLLRGIIVGGLIVLSSKIDIVETRLTALETGPKAEWPGLETKVMDRDLRLAIAEVELDIFIYAVPSRLVWLATVHTALIPSLASLACLSSPRRLAPR